MTASENKKVAIAAKLTEVTRILDCIKQQLSRIDKIAEELEKILSEEEQREITNRLYWFTYHLEHEISDFEETVKNLMN